MLAVVLLFGTSGCRSSEPKGPNVILISVDTLRADHLGTYGYERPTSPFIDRFAAEATVFEKAISPSSWTLPAHTSMMLSLHPNVHGVTNAGRSMDPNAITLAAILTDAGYATAAFVTAGLLEQKYGLGRGFADYDRVQPGTAEEVNRATVAWLRKAGRPFFLFLHYYDVHDPYVRIRTKAASYCPAVPGGPPNRYPDLVEHSVQRFVAQAGIDPSELRHPAAAQPPPDGDPIRRARTLARIANVALDRQGAGEEKKAALHDASVLEGDTITAAERECIAGLYDDGIGYVDEQLELLFGQLAEMNILDDSIVILTSDHGESLYEHRDYRGHAKYVYHSIVRVPLIVKFPGQKSGARVGELVSTVDLRPTILERLGIAEPSAVQGRSLVPLMGGQPSAEPRAVRSASHADQGFNAVVVGHWKLIRGPAGAELFDLAADPHERRNVAAEQPERAAALDAELTRLLAPGGARQAEPGRVELDAASREQLRALGYLD